MPRPTALESLLIPLIDRLADRLASRLKRLGNRGPKAAPPKAQKRRAGRKLDMSCRMEGCKNRSRGPRFGFMCEEHSKLPKREQQAAREAWKAKRAA